MPSRLAAVPGVTVGVLGDHRGSKSINILTVLRPARWQADMAG